MMPTSLSLTSMSSSESSLGGNIIGEYLGNSFGMIERGMLGLGGKGSLLFAISFTLFSVGTMSVEFPNGGSVSGL